MVSTVVALYLTTSGFYRGPCDPGTACILLSYMVYTGPELTVMLVFAALPLLATVDSSMLSRAAGIVGASGTAVIALVSVFIWGARYTYGSQLIFVDADVNVPFLLIWLLGGVTVGAAIAAFGCLRRFDGHRRVTALDYDSLGSLHN